MATIADVRLIGNLDEQVTDTLIDTNLQSATRELDKLVGLSNISLVTDATEAIACLTMVRLVSLLNLRFKTVNGVMDDVNNLKQYWQSRAYSIINTYKNINIRFYAV